VARLALLRYSLICLEDRDGSYRHQLRRSAVVLAIQKADIGRIHWEGNRPVRETPCCFSIAYCAAVMTGALLTAAGFWIVFGVAGWDFLIFATVGVFVLSLPLSCSASPFEEWHPPRFQALF
jgi:hypothetical protein